MSFTADGKEVNIGDVLYYPAYIPSSPNLMPIARVISVGDAGKFSYNLFDNYGTLENRICFDGYTAWYASRSLAIQVILKNKKSAIALIRNRIAELRDEIDETNVGVDVLKDELAKIKRKR